MSDFEIAVAGGGPTGLATALALGRAGFRTALLAPAQAPDDGRTAALLRGSVEFLEELGVWPALAPRTEALKVMEIADLTGRLLRAPTTRFEASEIGLDAFGFNAPNAAIVDVLAAAARAEPNVTWIEGNALTAEISEAGAAFMTEAGPVTALAAVAADGQRSLVRRAAGIESERWAYPQTALVLNLRHERPHRGVSTELHYPGGPFTLVPLPGDRSSLVWMDAPPLAARRAEESDAALARVIEERAHGIRGRMEVESRRWLYPLHGLLARRLASGRAALVGEAAHAFPPIAAQGLNLGLRDAAVLAECVSEAEGDVVGAFADYDRRRRADVFGRTFAVHMLNGSLLGGFFPLQIGRAAGLAALRASPALRKALMRAGVQGRERS